MKGAWGNCRGVLDSPQHSPLSTFHWTNSAVCLFVFTITEQAENKPLIYKLFLIRPSQKTEAIHMGKEDPLADMKRCWSRKQAWGKEGLDQSLAGPPVVTGEGWWVYELSSWMPTSRQPPSSWVDQRGISPLLHFIILFKVKQSSPTRTGKPRVKYQFGSANDYCGFEVPRAGKDHGLIPWVLIHLLMEIRWFKGWEKFSYLPKIIQSVRDKSVDFIQFFDNVFSSGNDLADWGKVKKSFSSIGPPEPIHSSVQ